MSLVENVTTPAEAADLAEYELQVVPGTMSASTAMPGDLLLIDVDGDLATISDRYFAQLDYLDSRLDDITTPVDETDYRIGLLPIAGNATALPGELDLPADSTRIVLLGDNFELSGLYDTSGNFGLNSTSDDFSFCDAGFPECSGGLFSY